MDAQPFDRDPRRPLGGKDKAKRPFERAEQRLPCNVNGKPIARRRDMNFSVGGAMWGRDER